MPFTPRYGALFINPLIKAIQAQIAEHEASALEWSIGLEGDAPLGIGPSVEPPYRSRRKRPQLPFIAVIGEDEELDTADQREYISQVHNIIIEIGDWHSDPDVLDEIMKIRVRAIDEILRQMEAGEIMGEIPRDWGVPDLEIGRHSYEMSNRTDGGKYAARAEITIQIAVNEA